MIPVYDENPIKTFPYVTVVLLAVNIGVFVYELTLSPPALQELFETYGFTPVTFFASPLAFGSITTLLTAMFLHGGWLHLGGNLLYLWIFGNNVEDRLGRKWFLALYLSGGLMATMTHALVYPESEIPLVGASGAIAALLGAYLVLYPKARVMTIIPIFFIVELASLPAAFVILMWFLLQLAQGVGSIGVATGVAWWAHIGGFAAGVLAVAPLVLGVTHRRRKHRARSKAERD